jgi:hypothetical protein
MIVDKDAEALGSELGGMQVGSGGGEMGVGDGGVVREFAGERITELRGHESRIFCAEWDPTGEIPPTPISPVSVSLGECGLHHAMLADCAKPKLLSSALLVHLHVSPSPRLSLSLSLSLSPSTLLSMLRQNKGACMPLGMGSRQTPSFPQAVSSRPHRKTTLSVCGTWPHAKSSEPFEGTPTQSTALRGRQTARRCCLQAQTAT